MNCSCSPKLGMFKFWHNYPFLNVALKCTGKKKKVKKVFSVLLEVTADGGEGCMMLLAVTMCSYKKS